MPGNANSGPPRKITPAVLARAVKLRDEQGLGVVQSAKRLGVGKSQLAAALKFRDEQREAEEQARASPVEQVPNPPPSQPEEEQVEPIDANGSPIEVLRALLAVTAGALAKLPPKSPRYNQVSTRMLAITNAIRKIEREDAKAESPEEAERRRRRESGATVERFELYVQQYEDEARAKGVCEKCGQPVTRST